MIRTRSTLAALTALALPAAAAAQADSQPAPAPDPSVRAPTVVQPGAPGQDARVLSAEERARLETPGITQADVAFVRGMIPHHAQALEMVALIPQRTDREALHLLGRRVAISQRDEIAFMERWLRDHGIDPVDADESPEPGAGADEAGEDHETLMPGMLTEAEMDRLAAAEGRAFERLFLESMIRHHRGALTMVRELLGTPGAGQESLVNQFAAEVRADQEMEIRRMRSLLDEIQGSRQ